MNEIDISKYDGYFHDGSILAIDHQGDKIIFSMTSAEMHEEDLQDNIPLSKDDPFKCLRGKLHVEGISKILIDNVPLSGILKQEYDDGDIFRLEIKKKSVEICVIWEDFPPKLKQNSFSVIKIDAKKIYWENIPDLPWD